MAWSVFFGKYEIDFKRSACQRNCFQVILSFHFISSFHICLFNLCNFDFRPVSDKTGKAIQHITFDALDVNEFEYKLNLYL
jgi:hypothetical protein